jgi:hypothetical protein
VEPEQMQALNEVLDNENIDEYSLDDGSISDNDYTQLVTPGTHVIIDSDRVVMVGVNRKKEM